MIRSQKLDTFQERKARNFVLRFFLCYLAFTLVYQSYLNHFKNEIDPYTSHITGVIKRAQNFLDFDFHSKQFSIEKEIVFYFDSVARFKITEGCNGLSISIIFISFILSFEGRIRQALWFIPFGIIILYVSNLLRILLISILSVNASHFYRISHDIIFPLILYTVVFLLWWWWIQINKSEIIE